MLSEDVEFSKHLCGAKTFLLKKYFITVLSVLFSLSIYAQSGWTLCNAPAFGNRVDDVFMVDTQVGYAVSGDGKIVKTTDGGDNWFLVSLDSNVYCRSVEFINTQKGFVGGFPLIDSITDNVFRKTTNGGASWTDITPLLDARARGGICGLAIPDSNTIYGCGNWYEDSAYIVKSIDGGNTWSFIDMHTYATHLIDMYFLNKDTGFATGTGLAPIQSPVILYTTDGGQNWIYKYQDTIVGYCWKIQHLEDQIYFASIEDGSPVPARILKSTDGGMSWNVHVVYPNPQNIEGVGFIDSLKGWTGGGPYFSFESNDGGYTWDTIPVCLAMNRVFKVNDTLLFASGNNIWRYNMSATGIFSLSPQLAQYAYVNCYPNPAGKNLSIDLSLSKTTHAMIVLLDETGKRVKVIDNTNKAKGVYKYQVDTGKLSPGIYHVVLKTHEDNQAVKVIVSH
jgi:photosystem II stability/assembly factor-like uncharacterized protein